MSVRYIYNSDGEYVAFLSGKFLYTPDAEWIGFTINGTEIHNRDGSYMGQLLNDDRIALNTRVRPPASIYPPYPPFTPFRPFAPFQRLRMPSLPYGWKDVFENGVSGKLTRKDLSDLQKLEGSTLIGGDGIFLGNINKNRFDSNSLGNQFGEFGSRYSSTSIFNPYSVYGNKVSQYSPFNQFSQTPPKFVKNGYELGRLTVNQYIPNRIDPEKFFLWFEQL